MKKDTPGTKRFRARWAMSSAAAALCLVASAGCGGDGGSDDGPTAKHKLTQADNALAKQLVFTLQGQQLRRQS